MATNQGAPQGMKSPNRQSRGPEAAAHRPGVRRLSRRNEGGAEPSLPPDGRRGERLLRGLLLLYLVASLLHFTHNAENVQDYPNLPQWISRSSVYWAWLSITAVGALGFVFYRARRYVSGLILLGLYAVVGLDGLLHYTRAPFAEHTHTMNFTILFEVVVASVLLIAVIFKAKVLLSEWKH